MKNVSIKPLLRSVEGIDSIHVEIPVNFHDIRLFCDHARVGKNERPKWVEGERGKWKHKGQLFMGGELINVTYYVGNKSCKFEFGGLMDYYRHQYKLQLLQKLLQFFKDRTCSVSRIDFAIDINIRWDMFLADMKGATLEFSESSVYFNFFNKHKARKKMLTMAIYDKAKQIDIFSTPISRLELRLFRPELNRLNITKMFDSVEDLMKAANLIYSTFEHQLKLHSIDGKFVYKIKTDAEKTLKDFVAFLHSDAPTIYRDDLFRVEHGWMLSKRILDWLKREGISPKDVKRHIRGRKMATCKSLGMDRKTFDKAITFFDVV